MTTSLSQQNLYRISDYPIDMSIFILPNLVEEDLEKQRKLEKLRNDIGDKLFYSLSEEDKVFILETEGMIDFGYKLTEDGLREIEKSLREDYEY